MAKSKLSLTPRGFGRSAFKVYEAIQMGLVPVYVYDQHKWLPYSGTQADFTNFGYSFSISEIEDIVQLAATISSEDIQKKRNNAVRMRDSHFTNAGIIDQIARWLHNDGSSDLTCNEHPACPIDDDPRSCVLTSPPGCWSIDVARDPTQS